MLAPKDLYGKTLYLVKIRDPRGGESEIRLYLRDLDDYSTVKLKEEIAQEAMFQILREDEIDKYIQVLTWDGGNRNYKFWKLEDLITMALSHVKK